MLKPMFYFGAHTSRIRFNPTLSCQVHLTSQFNNSPRQMGAWQGQGTWLLSTSQQQLSAMRTSPPHFHFQQKQSGTAPTTLFKPILSVAEHKPLHKLSTPQPSQHCFTTSTKDTHISVSSSYIRAS